MAEENRCRLVATLATPFVTKRVQCVGKQFLKLHNIHHDNEEEISRSSSSDQLFSDESKFHVDVDYLKSLDPKDWKEQDHYAVLGLKSLRFEATDDDIRRSYRKIVLKHHPDKRKAQGETVNQDDDYFTCITRAYEILGAQPKRRSYDSVDPDFDDTLPSQSEIEKNYFKYVGDAIKLNSRWSEKRNVPLLGDENSTRAEVEKFYDFWYDFQSWREFSYLDEEDKEKGQDREERRWIEKQNKAIRIKRKKEEMSRIRSLVDLAYNNDPRIVKFKKEEKEKKLATKRAKQTAIQMQKAEEERLQREALLAKQKAEEAEQKRIEVIQKEREQQKRALKKEKKNFRDMVKSNNYYSEDDTEKLKHMEGVEKICEMLKTIELQELNNELKMKGKKEFVKVLKEIEDKLAQEKLAMASGNSGNANNNIPNNPGLKLFDKKQLWTKDNIQLLIKAVNLFPAGTIQRWEVIANFINLHGTDLQDHKFYAKEVLNKAKDLQHTDFSKSELKAEANQNAFQSFEKQKKDLKKVDDAEISVNLDGDEAKNSKIQKKNAEKNVNGSNQDGHSNEPSQMNGHEEKNEKKKVAPATEATPPSQDPKTWTTEEQALLEQAIKTYPVSTPDRWDRIAECVKGRTKKDCLRRVKELVDLVNAKRDAQKVK